MKRSDRSVGTIKMDCQFKKLGKFKQREREREREHRTQKRGDVQNITKTPEGGRKEHTGTISQSVVTKLTSTDDTMLTLTDSIDQDEHACTLMMNMVKFHLIRVSTVIFLANIWENIVFFCCNKKIVAAVYFL